MKTNQENIISAHSEILLNSANLNTLTGTSHFKICRNHPSLLPNNDAGMDRQTEFTSQFEYTIDRILYNLWCGVPILPHILIAALINGKSTVFLFKLSRYLLNTVSQPICVFGPFIIGYSNSTHTCLLMRCTSFQVSHFKAA